MLKMLCCGVVGGNNIFCAGTGNRPAAAALLVACGNNLALCLTSLERWDAAGKALADVLAIDCNNVKATERHIKVRFMSQTACGSIPVTLFACTCQPARVRPGARAQLKYECKRRGHFVVAGADTL